MSAHRGIEAMARNYVAERRRLGFQLHSVGRTLASFARYVDRRHWRGPLTVELMADWARQDKWKSPKRITWARRLMLLRPFARYLQQFEPRTEVPDESIFGPIQQRPAPHIFAEEEIVALLAAARGLAGGRLRAATYETLFGLMAATGLRVSEAAHLLDTDVDLKLGLLTIRKTKFSKSRLVPVHPSVVPQLLRYRRLRNRYIEVDADTPFFISTRGRLLGRSVGLRTVHRVFASLRSQLGWANRGSHSAPRPHDLRHTFAVRRLTLWHEHGTDIDQAMLSLATYMGHAKITNTYWYLTGTPELMGLAAAQFERFTQMPEVSHA